MVLGFLNVRENMVRLNDLFGKEGGDIELPEPNIEIPLSGESDLTPDMVRGILCNPIYAGLGPFPAMISDADWVSAAVSMISQEGTEQFLVNLLHALRASIPSEF